MKTLTSYVPHGISSKRFFKINKNSSEFQQFERKYNLSKYDFKLLYLNRNIRRKVPGDVIMAYKHFIEQLPKDEQKKCVLIFHTAPVDNNGTDLRAVCKAIIPDQNVIFTYDISGSFDDKEMNFLYNSVDIYINLASNEGFGLGSCEALTVGTPIIVNVTGGLQDQCGFKKEDGSCLAAHDYIKLGTNHHGKYTEHGEWVKPVYPVSVSLAGSPQTPYIFDDRCSWKDAGAAIKKWYDVGAEERERCGELGRKFVRGEESMMSAKHMADKFINAIDTLLETWEPRERYDLFDINDVELKTTTTMIDGEEPE